MRKLIFVYLLSLQSFVAISQTSGFWQKQQTPYYPGKQDDIGFVDANKGWYCNGQGKIYHTENGGNDWKLIYLKPGTFFRCIGFIDSLRGFAGNVGTDYFPNVRDTIPIYQTSDGGKSWEPVKYNGPYVKGLCGKFNARISSLVPFALPAFAFQSLGSISLPVAASERLPSTVKRM